MSHRVFFEQNIIKVGHTNLNNNITKEINLNLLRIKLKSCLHYLKSIDVSSYIMNENMFEIQFPTMQIAS